ncbi:hypothetical protein B0T16DRAFT_385320 [Cercophora newfieldiana]|uniref:DUF7924 domain-containing protein n=1 Tax=Cercophora newfieldiana TaxID=92897 RepID=A0AA39YQ49_9PEZI|nr:hypothetical protein B0T16DRAFT_385320 [Cercophora newfieldiana]
MGKNVEYCVIVSIFFLEASPFVEMQKGWKHWRCQGRIPNVCYSLSIDNNLGQLYASWKAEEDGSTVYMQRVASFLLSDTEHFARLYACVASILKWGATTRLQDIRVAADNIGGERGE